MRIIKKTYLIENDDFFNIEADCRYPEDESNMPLIIFSHGFKGYKDWGFIPYYCEKIAESKAIVVNFNFSLNGKKDSNTRLYDASIFGMNTISREIQDLLKVIEYFKNEKNLKQLTNGHIILAGHSLGGAISVLALKNIEFINKLILIASISNCNRYTQRQVELWKSIGKFEFEIYDTKQKLFLDRAFLDDIEKNYPKDILCNILREINPPTLILHGKEDLTVRYSEAEELHKNTPNSKLMLIPSIGHTFGVEAKFTRTNVQLEKMINESINFIHN